MVLKSYFTPQPDQIRSGAVDHHAYPPKFTLEIVSLFVFNIVYCATIFPSQVNTLSVYLILVLFIYCS